MKSKEASFFHVVLSFSHSLSLGKVHTSVDNTRFCQKESDKTKSKRLFVDNGSLHLTISVFFTSGIKMYHFDCKAFTLFMLNWSHAWNIDIDFTTYKFYNTYKSAPNYCLVFVSVGMYFILYITKFFLPLHTIPIHWFQIENWIY